MGTENAFGIVSFLAGFLLSYTILDLVSQRR